MTLKLLSALFIAVLLAACSSSKGELAAYREEAAAYCQAHTPAYWIKSGRLDEINAMRPTEKAQALIKEFRLTIKSGEMATIVFEEGGKLPAQEFYPYLQEKIPELTQEPFVCPAIPEFYISQ